MSHPATHRSGNFKIRDIKLSSQVKIIQIRSSKLEFCPSQSLALGPYAPPHHIAHAVNQAGFVVCLSYLHRWVMRDGYTASEKRFKIKLRLSTLVLRTLCPSPCYVLAILHPVLHHSTLTAILLSLLRDLIPIFPAQTPGQGALWPSHILSVKHGEVSFSMCLLCDSLQWPSKVGAKSYWLLYLQGAGNEQLSEWIFTSDSVQSPLSQNTFFKPSFLKN